MLRWRDYHVRVWADGDVSISASDELAYSTLGEVDGIQCNADPDSDEYKAIYANARRAASSLRALDDAIGKHEKVDIDK